MKNIFNASVLAALISFGCMNAFAADAPTVADAHGYIGDLISRGLVYGDSTHDSTYSNYRGDGCQSSVEWGSAVA